MVSSSPSNARHESQARPATPSETSRPRRRWQFSLFTLLLVAIVACVVAAYLGTARRLEEAIATTSRQKMELRAREAEIARLEVELGKLTITDPSKVHILALPSKEEWHWRWRIYLPPGKTWIITQAVGEKVPKEGLDMSKLPRGPSNIIFQSKGEFTAEFWLQRDINGALRLNRQFGEGRDASGISDEDAKKLFANGTTTTYTAGSPVTHVHDPADTIELLRLHKYAIGPKPRITIVSRQPDVGILLFFEE